MSLASGNAKREGNEGEQHQPAVIRPGFEITARYTGHAGQVKQAIHNRKADSFLSIDNGAMHCWNLTGHVQACAVNTFRYPRGTSNFVTCMTYSNSAKLVFCACLDGNLRIFKNDMQLKSILAWDQTVVYDMHFLHSTNEIIATGIHGMKIYSTEADDDAYARSVKDPEDVLSHIAHETNEWAYGQCQKIKVRMELRVPGLGRKAKATGADQDASGRAPAQTLWVYEGSNLVCTSVGASIYGFNFRSGKRILNWEKLHTQYISQFLFLPDRGQAITVCEAPTALIWKLEGWNLKFVSKFGSFASIVVSLLRVPHSNSIMTATKDGSVKMWSLDTLQPQLAMKSAAGISSFNFIDTSRCLLNHGRIVRVLSLRHCFPVLVMCDSDVASMERTGKDSVLLWCKDDSAKIVDETTGLCHVLIPPQLAVHSAMACAWCPASASAYVLFQNYDIHVWSAHGGAVRLASVWKQHRRSKLQTLSLMPVATIPESERAKMGLQLTEQDVLLVGTADGDVALLNLQQGAMQLCFCAHKLMAIKKVIADETHHRLLSVADCSAKVWYLTGGIRSFGNISLPAPGTCVCKVGTLFIVGTACGSVHVINMINGLLSLSLKSAIHSDFVTTLHPAASKQCVISSSKDGTVKVWHTSGKMILSLVNTKRMQCACFLSNDDILIGSGKQVEVIRQPFDVSSRSLDLELELDCPEEKLPSFSKRALQLGLKGRSPGGSNTQASHAKHHHAQGDMQSNEQGWLAEYRRDACPHLVRSLQGSPQGSPPGCTFLRENTNAVNAVNTRQGSVLQMHGMKNLALGEVSLLGTRCARAATSTSLLASDMGEGMFPRAKVGAQASQGAGGVPSSFSQQVLQNARMVISARPSQARDRSKPMTDVERALCPTFRKALRVVMDPTAFLDGHQSKALESKATGRKKRRKMRKKKERPKALSALEKKSRDDSEVLAAVKQIRVQDARYEHTMRKLVPNQKIMALHIPAEAHE